MNLENTMMYRYILVADKKKTVKKNVTIIRKQRKMLYRFWKE